MGGPEMKRLKQRPRTVAKGNKGLKRQTWDQDPENRKSATVWREMQEAFPAAWRLVCMKRGIKEASVFQIQETDNNGGTYSMRAMDEGRLIQGEKRRSNQNLCPRFQGAG